MKTEPGTAFGMVMPEREYNVSRYRFGFNEKEMDNVAKGDGNSVNFGARIYDSKLGRFLSLQGDTFTMEQINSGGYII